MLKQRIAQGQPDSPEMRNAIREELNTRELLAREAKKANLDKNADVKIQMDLASQTVLVSAFVADWVKKNPISDAELRKEYDVIKAQIGDKEYRVKHILVEKEDEAKDIIAQLQKGAKFDELAKARSKDPGSKDKGGDLDWNAPAGFVKPFSDAMVATPKGKFSTAPVQTQFGYHVILVEDIREAKVPPFDEVKPQLQQRMQAATSTSTSRNCAPRTACNRRRFGSVQKGRAVMACPFSSPCATGPMLFLCRNILAPKFAKTNSGEMW